MTTKVTQAIGFVRAMLSVTRKCVEACGDNPGSVSFTYPPDYVEGMEFSASISICPETGVQVVLFKMDQLVDSWLSCNGQNKEEEMEILLKALEEFQKFCGRCDRDLALLDLLTPKTVRSTTKTQQVFIA